LNPLSQAKIGSKLQDIRPDIVHIHNYRGFSAGVFRAAGSVEAPVVHTLHDYASLSARSNLFNDGQISEPGLLMNIYQKVNEIAMGNHPDKIIAPSQFIIDKHHEQGVFSNIPAERVPLGINVEELSNTESRGESSHGLRLLYVGQLIKSKGVDVLIDAVSQISDPELEVHILGKGPEKDSLENRAQSDDRIQFHGFVPEDELVRQYSASDFTVVPSRWYDNSPMVIYESFTRRTPVIGARIGGIPELIKEGVTGYCFEPDQPSELADLISSHGSEAHELKENLSDVDVELKNHFDKLEDIYSSLSER
jgi:glycosyltransferase involved in cell wall biosynthesis